jgi:pyrroline-5-carboxylate reductase
VHLPSEKRDGCRGGDNVAKKCKSDYRSSVEAILGLTKTQVVIYGAGHLATALVEGFHRAGVESIAIYNRTPARAQTLAARFDSCHAIEKEKDIFNACCPVLLVIPGQAILELPRELEDGLRWSRSTVVSCANGLPLELIEATHPGIAWAKAVPTITAAVCRGVTPLFFGSAVSDVARTSILALFCKVGEPLLLEEDAEMDRISSITSCFPGLLAEVLDEWAHAFGLNANEERKLLLKSSLATLLALEDSAMSFGELVEHVARPGGLTGVGVAAIREEFPRAFAHVQAKMEGKIRVRREAFRLG